MTYRHSEQQKGPARHVECGLRWIGLASLQIPAVLAVAGLVMRLTLKDRIEVLAPLYYASPWAAITLFALLAAALAWIRRRPDRPGGIRTWLLFAGLAGLAGAATMKTSFEWRRPVVTNPGGDAVMRVVLWNAGGLFHLPVMVEQLRRTDADIAVVVEIGHQGAARRALEHLQGYHNRIPGGHMAIFSREDLTFNRWWNYDHLNRFLDWETTFQGQPLRLVGVDVYSLPTNSRRTTSRHAARVGREDQIPTIVLGDFNTPGDSVWFDRMREDFDHAFDVAGSGYSATWPEPFPAVQIDHVWLEKGAFEILQMQQIDTGLSDHRMVVVDLKMKPRPPQP